MPIAHPIKGQGIYAFVSLMQACISLPPQVLTVMHPGTLSWTVLLLGIHHVMERIGQSPGYLCKSPRPLLSQRRMVIPTLKPGCSVEEQPSKAALCVEALLRVHGKPALMT